jgi:hypothetical protein
VPTLRSVQLSGYKREKRPVRIVSYGKEAQKKQEAGPVGGLIAGESGRAEVDDHGLAVTFSIKGKESLPADRRPHKVEVTTTQLDATLGYEAIPKISPWVYLKATAKNSTPFPILAGEVDVFRSSGYVGTGNLEFIAPGEEFAVSLGVDEDLKVKRVIDEKVDRAPKLFGSTRTIAYGYTIEVSNFKTAAQSITLDAADIVDLLPLPGLVRFAEDLTFDEETVLPYLREELSRFDMAQFQTVVLGCTHFIYFRPVFRTLLGGGLDIIDGNRGTVNMLLKTLDDLRAPMDGCGRIAWYRSGVEVTDEKTLRDFDTLLKREDHIG